MVQLAGEAGGMGAVTEPMVREVLADTTFVTVPRAAHWVPEENPAVLVDAITKFT